jgi:hypothetical protein
VSELEDAGMVGMKRVALFAFLIVLVFASCADAQQPTTQPPYQAGDMMPTSMFYWLVGIAGTLGGGLVATIKILWGRLNKPPDGCIFNKDAEASLQTFSASMKKLQTTYKETADRWNTERTELRGELAQWQNRYFRQQTKMEKLAVRVQRAVEAVAGLETPEVESDLDDVDQG